MHDREEHLFDQAFTDRAWSEMKQLLDREMPVHGKQHRLMWLWALSLIILGGLGWLFGPTSNVVRVEETASFPLVDQAKRMLDSSSPADLPAAILSDDSSNQKVTHQKPSRVVVPNKLTRENTDSEPPVSANAENINEEPTITVVSKNKTSESLTSNSSSTEEESWTYSHEQLSSAEDQVESDNFLMKEQERNSQAVAALPFLSKTLKELSWPLRETPESNEFKSKVNPIRSNWDWGAQAFMLSTDMTRLSGGTFGVWGQRPHFFTSRLALRVGLQYEQLYLTPSAVSVPSNAQLDITTEDNTDPTTSIPPNRQVDSVTASEAATQLNLSVRQVQLPVSLRWRLGQNWTAFGGAHLSYRNAFIRQPENDDQGVSFSGSDPQQGLYSALVSLDPGTTLPSEYLDRWDIGAHVGLGYRLNNRLEMLLSYEHGFRNLFSGLDLQVHDRKMNLGLSYRFGQ